MAETLMFRKLLHYPLNQIGITIPVRLQWGGKQSVFTAKVDTGASFCIFARVHGEELGLDIEAGRSQRIGTVMGSFLTFAHPVTLSVLEISLGQLRKAERGLRGVNTAYASDLIENLGS